MEEDIRKKIHSLDNEFPKVDWTPDEAWDLIQEKKNNGKSVYIGWSIAAALVVGAAIFFWPSNEEKVTITYREERITPDTIKVSGSWGLIEESCRAKVVVCESKEFIDLKKQWEELQNESNALDRQERQFGQNPAISKARQKVESIKQDLEKEMLLMINS